MSDVVIIGGGFSGLFSACLTSMNGLETTLVTRGRGGLSLSNGAIELYNRASPSTAISRLEPPHPYALAGRKALIAGLKHFLEITDKCGLSYEGGRSSNRSFLTATGSKRSAAYLPTSLIQRHPENKSLTIASFKHLRDFQASYAQNQANSKHPYNLKITELPLLQPITDRELYPTDIARFFDDPEWTAENARAWKSHLVGAKELALPAVIGLENHETSREIIEEILSIPIFEVPTLPPSIPGLRLERSLREFASDNGTRFIEGPTAIGRVQRIQNIANVAGVMLETAGEPATIDSKVIILATGSFLHGGLIATQDQRVYEPVFNIPVYSESDRSQWTGPSIFNQQHYATFGVCVDETMRPLDVRGEVLLDNLYAVGGILQAADRTQEGSRQGIDISTAYCAFNHLKGIVS